MYIYLLELMFIRLLFFSVQTLNTNSRIDETNMSSIIEVYTDELLFTSSGRQALKVCNKYMHYKLLCLKILM